MPEPLLKLLTGRWSMGIVSNFVLTFAGKPTTTLVDSYKLVLLKPFPPIFQLVTNHGFKKLAIHSVLCLHYPDGSLPSSTELLNELRIGNPHLQPWRMLDQP